MFSGLSKTDLEVVLDAMDSKFVQKGQRVISEGDSGNELYVVESGVLQCSKTFVSKSLIKYLKGGQDKHLRDYVAGEAFGELALLYGAPRAATIIAKTEAQLWVLDRYTFNHIVKGAAT